MFSSKTNARAANDEGANGTDATFDIRHSSVPDLQTLEPPARGVAGLPYGWLPIIISAAAFGIAHFGYGPEPVPLFFLGLVLGFVYQRTHRIVPCIVAHSLFNLFTMVVLWRMVFYGAQ